MDENLRREDLAVHVRRDNVFEDSFRELHRRTPEEWKNRFYIVFEGEEGQDAGGLLREWYVIISKEIFNPMYALFKTSPGDKVTYMIYEQVRFNFYFGYKNIVPNLYLRDSLHQSLVLVYLFGYLYSSN